MQQVNQMKWTLYQIYNVIYNVIFETQISDAERNACAHPLNAIKYVCTQQIDIFALCVCFKQLWIYVFNWKGIKQFILFYFTIIF